MKSTEIIQKLLDEKKITAEEALCLLQDMTQPSIIQTQPTWTYPYNLGEVWCGSTTSTLQQVESSCCQCCNTKSEKIEEKQPNIITEGYVDLGLPSGTLWAACNYGCNSPEESGGYYNNNDAQKLDCTLPSKEQIEELKEHTTYKWGTFNEKKEVYSQVRTVIQFSYSPQATTTKSVSAAIAATTGVFYTTGAASASIYRVRSVPTPAFR